MVDIFDDNARPELRALLEFILHDQYIDTPYIADGPWQVTLRLIECRWSSRPEPMEVLTTLRLLAMVSHILKSWRIEYISTTFFGRRTEASMENTYDK